MPLNVALPTGSWLPGAAAGSGSQRAASEKELGDGETDLVDHRSGGQWTDAGDVVGGSRVSRERTHLNLDRHLPWHRQPAETLFSPVCHLGGQESPTGAAVLLGTAAHVTVRAHRLETPAAQRALLCQLSPQLPVPAVCHELPSQRSRTSQRPPPQPTALAGRRRVLSPPIACERSPADPEPMRPAIQRRRTPIPGNRVTRPRPSGPPPVHRHAYPGSSCSPQGNPMPALGRGTPLPRESMRSTPPMPGQLGCRTRRNPTWAAAPPHASS